MGKDESGMMKALKAPHEVLVQKILVLHFTAPVARYLPSLIRSFLA
jgi:hypothetical protein